MFGEKLHFNITWPLRSWVPVSSVCISHLHIIRTYKGNSLKSCWKTPQCPPFSAVSRVRECFEMLKRSLLQDCRFNDALNQPNISLMSVPDSICLFSEGSYSQTNGPSYLCNDAKERTHSVEISFVIWKRTRWADIFCFNENFIHICMFLV